MSEQDTRNVFPVHGDEFFLEYLEREGVAARGSNSSIFRAQHPDGDEAYIVKFFRFLRETQLQEPQRRLQRFEREIQALRRAGESEYKDCVIPMIEDGSFSVGENKSLRYYVMKEAESDLALFLRRNDLSTPQRVFLCSELLRILRGLHALGIYHRDIKPENILMISDRPLFGDLGLISFRHEDADLDRYDEKIGPIGFLSPEATNKCLGIRNKASFTFDCGIDDKSDIFQLGQIFWLVLQDEVPTGQLHADDVKFSVAGIYAEIILPMLQYPKMRRASLDAIGTAFTPVLRELALA